MRESEEAHGLQPVGFFFNTALRVFGWVTFTRDRLKKALFSWRIATSRGSETCRESGARKLHGALGRSDWSFRRYRPSIRARFRRIHAGDQGAHCRPLDPASLSLGSVFASVALGICVAQRLFLSPSGSALSGGSQLPITLVEDRLLAAYQPIRRRYIADG